MARKRNRTGSDTTRQRRNAQQRARRAAKALEAVQAAERKARGRLKRATRKATRSTIRAELAELRSRQDEIRGRLSSAAKSRGTPGKRRASGEKGRGRGQRSRPASSGGLVLYRKPRLEDWKGPFRRFTKATPKKGKFEAVLLVKGRLDSPGKKSKGPRVIPIKIGRASRRELRELGTEALLELATEIKPSLVDGELLGVVALKSREERKGLRFRKPR